MIPSISSSNRKTGPRRLQSCTGLRTTVENAALLKKCSLKGEKFQPTKRDSVMGENRSVKRPSTDKNRYLRPNKPPCLFSDRFDQPVAVQFLSGAAQVDEDISPHAA